MHQSTVQIDAPPAIESSAGRVIHNPRPVCPNSRRILDRMTQNVLAAGSIELGESGEGEKPVLVLAVGRREFDVVEYRSLGPGQKRRLVKLAMQFIADDVGNYYPVRYVADPPRDLEFKTGGLATRDVAGWEQRQLAGHADDWLRAVERLIERSPVAQAG